MLFITHVFYFADASHKRIHSEYETVFKNIPKLLQHFIEVADEKPEVLERNDVSVFKRDIKRKHNVRSNDNYNHTTKRDVEKYLESSEEHGGDPVQNADIIEINTIEDFDDGPEDREHTTDGYKTTPNGEEFSDYVFLGSNSNIFKLTPEEISKNAILVEQMLKNHNGRK